MPFLGLEDLDSRKGSEEGAWMPLRSPRDGQSIAIDGERLELLIAGPDSKRYQDMIAEMARRFARARANSKDGEVAPEDARRINAECVAMVVLDWRGFREMDGAEARPTADRVTRLFTERPWAREQTETFSGSRAHFLPPSGRNGSAPSADG